MLSIQTFLGRAKAKINEYFLHLAGWEVHFSSVEFSSFGRETIFFSKTAKKFVIWLFNYFFVKRQEYFRQKAAPPQNRPCLFSSARNYQ